MKDDSSENNSMQMFDQQVSLCRLSNTPRCVSAAGFSPSGRKKINWGCVHWFQEICTIIWTQPECHCPPQRQNTDVRSAEKQGNISEERELEEVEQVSPASLIINKSHHVFPRHQHFTVSESEDKLRRHRC